MLASQGGRIKSGCEMPQNNRWWWSSVQQSSALPAVFGVHSVATAAPPARLRDGGLPPAAPFNAKTV